MARVTGPVALTVPGVVIQGVPLLVPIDVPEGGFLQVVIGPNPLVPATPSLQLAPGSMVAVIPPNVAEVIRPKLEQAQNALENPTAGLPTQ